MLGATVRDVAIHQQGVTASIRPAARRSATRGACCLSARSASGRASESLAGASGRSRISRQIAWRRTVRADLPAAARLVDETTVTRNSSTAASTWWPIRCAALGHQPRRLHEGRCHQRRLVAQRAVRTSSRNAMRGTAPALLDLAQAGDDWTTWPIHTVRPWTPYVAGGSMALNGCGPNVP